MLSDLSPGDKLSLKGKIFELQKKLQIIDQRNKQKEEFSYKPKLYSYDLPDREDNVLKSIDKAEIIRKVCAGSEGRFFYSFCFIFLWTTHISWCTTLSSNGRTCFKLQSSFKMSRVAHSLLS